MAKHRTLLEELAAERTRITLGATITRTIEQTAEDLASDLLREPQFRAQLRAAIGKHFRIAVDEFVADKPTTKRRNGQKPKRKA